MKTPLRNRLGLRIALPAVIVVLSVGIVAVLINVQHTRYRQGRSLDAYAGLLSRVVMNDVHDAMLSRDRARIDNELRQIGSLSPIHSVRILAADGKVRFSNDLVEVGTAMPTSQSGCVECHPDGEPTSPRRTLRWQTVDHHALFRSVEPIRADVECLKCHKGAEDRLLGLLVIDLDDEALTGELQRSSRRLATGVAVVALLAGLLIAVVLRRQVVAPLRQMRGLLEGLRRGERDGSISAQGGAIGEMVRSVQQLNEDLEARYGLERQARRLTAALERHPGPALLIGPAQRVFAANGRAIRHYGVDGKHKVLGRRLDRKSATSAGCCSESPSERKRPGIRA